MTATGTYDNERTGRREEWLDGKLLGVAGAWSFGIRPFGYYPDLPRQTTVKTNPQDGGSHA